MVVIVVIPIAIGVPAVSVLVPPAMRAAPAIFASFVQIVTGTVGLAAVPAVMLDGFVELVVRAGDATLTIVIVGPCGRRSRK
jgi:hypothetical protein